MEKYWYAIYTKPNYEKKLASLLTKRKVENFYPLNHLTSNILTNKRKVIEQPLLPCFVFVHIYSEDIIEIKKTNYVINFIYWLGKPAVISPVEIKNMENFTKEFTNIQLEKTMVNPNELVRLFNEHSIDYYGNYLSVKNEIISLGLPSLGYMMVAKMEKSSVSNVFNYTSKRSIIVL